MFCYQRSFGLPTEVVTLEQFRALIKAPKTSELIDAYRATGDAAQKRKLPAFIFQATFDETVSKKGNKGAWRCQAGARLNGLVVMDIDHVEDPKALFDSWGLSNSKEPRNQGKIPKFPDSLDKKEGELAFKGIPYSEIISEWWKMNGRLSIII
jgi:hypothetical protein